jgi:sugar fermentation stimulation protein A
VNFPELVRGRFLARRQRFFVDVELEDGSRVTAHCANTGTLRSVLEPAPEVWLSRAREGRLLPFTWEVAVLADGTRVYVNPAGANGLVVEALERGAIAELRGYDVLRTEVPYGEASRIDILLSGAPREAYVEVKNVTLGLGEGRAAFPDAVTTRGARHLEELSRVVAAGARGVLLFCVARSDARSVEAAEHIDAAYAAALRRAAAAGVEVLAYGGELDSRGFWLTRPVPVVGLPSRDLRSRGLPSRRR